MSSFENAVMIRLLVHFLIFREIFSISLFYQSVICATISETISYLTKISLQKEGNL